MIYKEESRHENKVHVTFQIAGSVWAERIHLVGDFNDWNRESLPFRHTRDENWQIDLDLDRGREYRFRYLIDGHRWGNDWHADRHVQRTDGSSDSVIVAELPSQTQE
jgi:1,4-alpha-glucan branching enzyme